MSIFKVFKQPKADAGEIPLKLWKKRLAWALPVFFLIKGMLWLAIPLLSALYVLD